MDTKKLRQKILDLAIRGKLVPQDPNDEPASVLLERIRAEKERLIKEGKIKRSKKSISDEEIDAPFEIPENWEWCILPDLCSIPITDGTHQTPTYSDRDNGVPFISSKDVTSQRINWKNIKFITKDLHESLYKRIAPQRDDILLAKNGTTGVAAIVEDDSVFDIYVTLAVIRPIKELVLPIYLWRVINSDFCKKQFNDHLTGIGLPNLHLADIKKTIIPLPPFAEQKRIVNEVDRWFAVIDVLESNEDDLLKAIAQAKSKILDLAIHGKLVPQDPNDEPAIELLKRINPKFEPCDNNSYDIPKNWSWARGVDIFEPMKSISPSGTTFKYIDIESIDNKRNIIIAAKQINTKDAPSRASRYTEKGNVLFSMVRPYLRNIAMVSEDDCIASTGFYVCRAKKCLNSSFCLYMIISDYVVDGLNEYMKGDNSPSINKSHIDSFAFPLPPLNEQKRIVAKIEELFAVLDSIKESLE